MLFPCPGSPRPAWELVSPVSSREVATPFSAKNLPPLFLLPVGRRPQTRRRFMSEERKKAVVLPPRPLPGTPPARPEGMRDYIVHLKEEAEQPSGQGRRAIFEANVARNRAFLAHLERWLDEHDMRSQVVGVGEPMGFGIVTLTTTPAVARAIEGFPEVELVLADSGGTMRAIR